MLRFLSNFPILLRHVSISSRDQAKSVAIFILVTNIHVEKYKQKNCTKQLRVSQANAWKLEVISKEDDKSEQYQK